MVRIEVQYFDGCPNSDLMIVRVREAIERATIEIDCKERLVDTPELADQFKFRGSPTLLIDDEDIEGLPVPEKGNLSCRYYINGIPETDQILQAILQKNSIGNRK